MEVGVRRVVRHVSRRQIVIGAIAAIDALVDFLPLIIRIPDHFFRHDLQWSVAAIPACGGKPEKHSVCSCHLGSYLACFEWNEIREQI
jgi:hypothetical protein